MAKEASDADSQSDDSEGDENEDEDEDEDEEPRLKYGSLTKSVGSIYRNGDATSACLLSGDKMVRMPCGDFCSNLLRIYC
jgi:hypothetical protein